MSYEPASGTSPGVRENRLLQAWSAGLATLNGWLVLPDPSSAEAMAHAGWDSLTLDMQHSLIDYAQAVRMLMAISTTDTVPLVRVPWLEEGLIMKMLDAGAYGITPWPDGTFPSRHCRPAGCSPGCRYTGRASVR